MTTTSTMIKSADLDYLLDGATAFVVGVTALVDGITSSESTINVSRISAPAQDAPAAPGNFQITASGVTDVTLGWSAVSGATGYVVYKGDSDGFSPASGVLVYNGTGTSCWLAGLDMSGSSTYYFRVAGVNADNTAPGALNFSGTLAVTG